MVLAESSLISSLNSIRLYPLIYILLWDIIYYMAYAGLTNETTLYSFDVHHCSAMWWDSMTTRQPTAHYHRSQQQELVTALVLVGGDSQDARAIHGSSGSAMVHPSAFVLNGPRLVVVATPDWRNGPLLSTRSDDDDDDVHQLIWKWHCCTGYASQSWQLVYGSSAC